MASRRPGRFRETSLPDIEIKLRCVECEQLTEYVRKDTGVYCAACGKRHSRASLVDTAIGGPDDQDE